MKKKISLVLSIVLMLSTLFSVNVFAASYPTISSSKYIEFKAQQNIDVYKDTACKTRGTSSPPKKYNAYISKNDACYIYKITDSYIQVNYPTSSGRRTGYIRRSDLFDKTTPEEYIPSAKASVTVYKANGSSSIAKGDKVWQVDPKVGYSGYRAVIYEAKSGKRAYKMGYVTLADLDKIKNATPTPTPTVKKGSLVDVARAEVGKSGKNDNSEYGRWIGKNPAPWCASFVSWCVYYAGVSTKIVPKTASCDEMKDNSSAYHKWSADALSKLDENDIVFFAKGMQGSDSNHVGIVSKVSGKKVTIIEGNTGDDMVKERTYTVVNKKSGKNYYGYVGYWNGGNNYFCGYIAVD